MDKLFKECIVIEFMHKPNDYVVRMTRMDIPVYNPLHLIPIHIIDMKSTIL